MANKVYRAVETALTFKESGGDIVITLKNLGFGAGRISARVDRGAGSKPVRYKWRAVMQWEDHPAVADSVSLFLAESDGTVADGNVGTADAALTQLANLVEFGAVRAEAAAGSTNRIGSGVVRILDRYFSIGVWNRSATKNLKNADNVSYIILTPMPDEIQ